jgi:hypothetical protein
MVTLHFVANDDQYSEMLLQCLHFGSLCLFGALAVASPRLFFLDASGQVEYLGFLYFPPLVFLIGIELGHFVHDLVDAMVDLLEVYGIELHPILCHAE